MIPELHRRFNDAFTEARYAALVAKSPLFFDAATNLRLALLTNFKFADLRWTRGVN